MNKKGMELSPVMVIMGIALVIVVFLAASWFFGGGLKKLWASFTGLGELTDKEIEALRKATEEKRLNRAEAIKSNCNLLVQAADFIKNGEPDSAIKKYLEYSKVYQVQVENAYASCYGVNLPEHIKFRILNALRDKLFILKNTDIDANIQFKSEDYDNLISKEEFTTSVINFNILNEYLRLKKSGFRPLSQGLASLSCNIFKQNLDSLSKEINKGLEWFETSEEAKKKDMTDFNAEHYRFIKDSRESMKKAGCLNPA